MVCYHVVHTFRSMFSSAFPEVFAMRLFCLDTRCYSTIIKRPIRLRQRQAHDWQCICIFLRRGSSDIVPKSVCFVQVLWSNSPGVEARSLLYWLQNELIKELESAFTLTIGTTEKWLLAKVEETFSLGFVFFLFPQDMSVRISI